MELDGTVQGGPGPGALAWEARVQQLRLIPPHQRTKDLEQRFEELREVADQECQARWQQRRARTATLQARGMH